MTIRTRFAPSPTGYLHVGGVRTALFAWLLSRQASGQFILRIEDTDKSREVEGSDQHIIDSLNALGLNYDEGPDKPGDFGPYRQSERLDIYKEWALKLIEAGRAYADPYSEEQLNEFRLEAKTNKQPFLFRNYRPENPRSWQDGQPLRFKSEPKAYNWHDEIMGDLSAGAEVVDDFILIKSDGYPTYNFAHIVDDHLMQISHIIRSQEFLASVPRYLNLYEALGINPPIMATTPPVLGPDGNKKLSKRDGAKDVLEYIKDGFLPDGLINFMASLGWNDGSEQEVFTTAELIQKFKLDHVQRSGARFDDQRLIWMNGAHIRLLKLDDLFDKAKGYWPTEANDYDDDYKRRVLSIIQERLKYLSEITELTLFFFKDLPVNTELIEKDKKLKDIDKTQLKSWLEQTKAALEASDFSVEDLTNKLNALLQTTGQKPAVLFSLIRIATTQSPSSPGLFESLNVLGKDRTIARIDTQLATL